MVVRIAADLSSVPTKGQVPLTSTCLFHPPQSLEQRGSVSPFHKWGTGDSKNLRNSTQVIQLERGRLELKPGSERHQGPALFSTPHSGGSEEGFQCHPSREGKSQGQLAQSIGKGFLPCGEFFPWKLQSSSSNFVFLGSE